jgi:hypothetical protein
VRIRRRTVPDSRTSLDSGLPGGPHPDRAMRRPGIVYSPGSRTRARIELADVARQAGSVSCVVAASRDQERIIEEVVLSRFNVNTGTLTSGQRGDTDRTRGLDFRRSREARLAALALTVATLLLPGFAVSQAADTTPPAAIQDLRVGAPGSLPVWVAPSLVRVGRSDAAGTLTQMDLYAARGESESFQVIVRAPTGGLTNVRVSASDLTGPGGVIAARNLSLFREQYVYVSHGSTTAWGPPNLPSGAPGWFPDGLIPSVDPDTGAPLSGAQLTAFPFTLAAGQDQPVWIDVNVPRGTAAGQYTGTVTVSAAEGIATVSLALTVWGFDLPVQPNLKSLFAFSGNASTVKNKELLRNRLMPAPVNASDERTMIDNFGLNAAGTGPWSGANIGTCTMSAAPSVSTFQQLATQHQTGLLLYDYSADEIGGCIGTLKSTIRAWALNMHSTGIKNLITMAPDTSLYYCSPSDSRPAVDIWAMLPVQYEATGAPARVAYVLGKGCSAWSYNTLVQDAYSPKWEIDFSPLNYRVQPGFISQSLSLTGLLYWRIDLWSSDPWNNMEVYTSGSNVYPGEAMLVYPGTQVGIPGVAPSMRLRWLRDGADDFDYVQILKGLGQSDFALGVARTVGQDWHTWTRDPAALENARRQLGQKINTLLNP